MPFKAWMMDAKLKALAGRGLLAKAPFVICSGPRLKRRGNYKLQNKGSENYSPSSVISISYIRNPFK